MVVLLKECQQRQQAGYSEAMYNVHAFQEAQLMLTNPCDAFRGQSRPPNILPFHMLGIVSSCAIVTLSLRCAVFPTFDFKRCRDLEIGSEVTQSLKVVPFDRLCMVSYIIRMCSFKLL